MNTCKKYKTGSNIIRFPDIILSRIFEMQPFGFGLAKRLVFCAENNYIKPPTFRAIAGMKIFRDEIYGGLKIIFRADYRNYAKTGVYDFPQKNIFKTIFYRLGYLITSIGFIQKKMIGNMLDFMVRPYKYHFAGEGK